MERKGGAIAGKNDVRGALQRHREGASRILIVGQGERLTAIASALGASNRGVALVDGVASALDEIGKHTPAIVLVPPACDRPLGEAIHALASVSEGPGSPPVYVVCSERVSDSDARSHYLAGAAGVFEWPRESLLLTRMVRDRLVQARERRGPGDSLAQAVRARLGEVSTRRPPRGLRVRVRGGLARLSGRVDSLWARLKLAERAKQTPGIERVAAQEVSVEPAGRTDGEIAASIQALLRGAAGIEHHTLAVMVHDAHATVLGWVESSEEQVHLSELIGLTEGVRGVNDRTEVDADATRRDAMRAHALEAELGERFSALDVHVAVMGDAAVLDGCVPRRSIKLAVQGVVYAHPFTRVLNRITVNPLGLLQEQ